MLTPLEPVPFRPREATSIGAELDILEGFAHEIGRSLETVGEMDAHRRVQRLLDGEADLLAASLTVTEARKAVLDFAQPHLYTDELVITSVEEHAHRPSELEGWSLCVRTGSSYAETLNELRESGVAVRVQELPPDVATEQILERVADGSCQATLADRSLWNAVAAGFPKLHAVTTIAEDRPIAIAVHPDRDDLRRKLNQYMIARALTGDRERRYVGDLPTLEARGRLRMLTRNNAVNYFLHRGKQLGFEYELLRRFAEQHGLILEVAVPPSHELLRPWLLEGRGDVIAAQWTVTPERAQHLRFTAPYLRVDQIVAVRERDSEISEPSDLAGRQLWIRRGSAYAATARRLLREVEGLKVHWLPSDVETERILAGVDDGTYDATICDQHLLDMERAWGRQLRAAFAVQRTKLAWAVRPSDSQLAHALNRFIAEEHRGLHYNLWYARYFESQRHIERTRSRWRSDTSGRISQYDATIRREAARYGLDWRLVAAQIFQESRFDPQRRSWAGAVGLLQMLPDTARAMGASDPFDPEQSIAAGCRYLRRLADLFDRDLPLATRLRFALASYNAGRGHVLDARRLAASQGLSDDRWYDNVERAMLLLEEPEYHRRTRYGYCRGSEPVRYVRRIERRYRAYVEQLPEPTTGS